jgi:hypothetical protein
MVDIVPHKKISSGWAKDHDLLPVVNGWVQRQAVEKVYAYSDKNWYVMLSNNTEARLPAWIDNADAVSMWWVYGADTREG